MMPMVFFPFGTSAQAVSLSVSTLVDMSERAVPFIQAGNLSALADLLRQHRIPLLHQGNAVRQLAAGLGIAYPDRVDITQVERVAASVKTQSEKAELALSILTTSRLNVEVTTLARDTLRKLFCDELWLEKRGGRTVVILGDREIGEGVDPKAPDAGESLRKLLDQARQKGSSEIPLIEYIPLPEELEPAE